MQQAYQSIDEYIGRATPDVQPLLAQLRETIRQAAPQASETIKYAMPTFVLHENLVHFAAYKNHVGFYPTPSGILAFKEELKPYRTSKGAIQFPIHKPLPLDLVSRITAFRVTESTERALLKKALMNAKKKQ